MSDWGATVRVPAVVTVQTGEVYPGHIHLLGGLHWQAGPETPLEMLNREEAFFPLTLESGTTLFFSKAQVVMVVAEWPPEDVSLPDPPVGDRHGLGVQLTTGDELTGEVTVMPRPTRTRTLDHLNIATPFFLLETASGVRLINRAHVRMARPLD
jgi:hypothetical protein